MRLHQRGVDLLVNLMDTQDHFDNVSREELRQLIHEAVIVFGQIIERDTPEEPDEKPMAGPARLV
ncbi:hypothetical protein [Mesorhizobium sp. A556]